jgi:very-short-patch-repair endonuclease
MGGFIARLDLAWPERKVAIEYDGAHHLSRRQHSRDLERHNRLRAAGWTVLQVDAAQFARFDAIVATLARLLAA